MEDKRRDLRMLAAACAAALLVVAVLVLLFLSGRSGRKRDEIVLPESRPAQEQEDTPREEESVLTVTADNVQTVLQSMTRLSAFHQTFTVTRRSGTHTRTAVVDLWASGGRVRAESTDSFETRYLLTDGETIFIWYEGETPTGFSMQDGATYEDLTGLPTYEDIIRLPASAIREGGFLADGQTGLDLVYVRALTDGAERQYWVSTDSGLLYRQATTVDGTVVYEAEQTLLEPLAGEDAALADAFRLPDGTDPFTS